MRGGGPGRWTAWLGIAALLWLVAVVVLYYVPHKPFLLEDVFGAARALRDLVTAAAILSLAGGLGLRLVPRSHPDTLASASMQASLGLGIFSLGVLVAGLVPIYRAGFGWLALALLAVLLWRPTRAWLTSLGDLVPSLLSANRFVWAVCGLVGLILIASLAEALAPPAHFDALVYHLALPAEFLSAERLIFTPGNPYWGMPLGAEMLYVWAMAVGRPQTAAVLGWFMGAMALVGVLGLGRGLGRHVGWVGVAVLLTGETLASSLGWAYADWTVALHGVALLVALDACRLVPGVRRAAWAGVMAGLAFGAKYSAVVGILAGAAVLLATGRGRERWRLAVAFTAAAALLAAPWLVKNWLAAGTPLYPFIGASPWMEPMRQAFYRGAEAVAPVGEALLTPVLAPLQGVEGAPGYAASLGPLLLGLLPGVALVRRRSRSALICLGVFLLSGWALWIAGRLYSVQLAQSRLYYVLYPAWAVLAGAGFAGLSRIRLPGIRLGRLAAVMVLLPVGLAAITSLLATMRDHRIPAALGLESEEDYRARRLGAYAPAMDALPSLGPQASVLMLWEARGLDCRPVCRPDAWIDRWFSERNTLAGPDAILERWRGEGVTHVLVNRAGMEFIRTSDARYQSQDWQALEDLLGRLDLLSTFGEGYSLFWLPP
jgi:hypothetical protein